MKVVVARGFELTPSFWLRSIDRNNLSASKDHGVVEDLKLKGSEYPTLLSVRSNPFSLGIDPVSRPVVLLLTRLRSDTLDLICRIHNHADRTFGSSSFLDRKR